MNKYRLILLVIVLLGVNQLIAQQKTFNIIWENNKEIRFSNTSFVKIHGFQDQNLSYNESDRTLLFNDEFSWSGSVNENNFSITNLVYENINEDQLSGFDKEKIKQKLEVKVRNTNARGKRKVFISFNPLVKTSSGFQKVKTLSINFNESFSSSSIASSLPITNSELATGDWYKFYVTKSGVHRINRSFLSDLGIDVSNVNPQNIRLFGNGGKSVPLRNADVSNYDVTENAIKFIGETDGVINNGDYILFYAQGPTGYNYENDSHINPYTDKTYYYINVGSVPGKRIGNMIEPATTANHTIDTFDEYKFHEVDNTNIVKVGRRWFGEEFNIQTVQTFSFSFDRLDTSIPVNLKVSAAGVSTSSTSMQIQMNGQEIEDGNSMADLPELSFAPISDISLARGSVFSNQVPVSQTGINVTLSYLGGANPSANAFLDYISVEGTSFLRSLGSQFSFRKNNVTGLSGVGEYVMSNANSVSEIWDVTDIFNVTAIDNNQGNTFSFKAQMGELREYVAVVNTDYYSPSIENGDTRVSNIDLKGTIFLNGSGVQEDIDYLVVTPRRYRGQAERLAQINAQNNGLRTRVVNLEDVYTEFNTGNQDIGAIRNLVKYVYDNGTIDKLRFLCLMGDASFDMKDRTPNNTNIVPTFHTVSSFSLATSFMSDDFFGNMDASEGTMIASDKLDVAVGRLVFDGVQQANEMVTKVQQYYEKGSYGSWRNNLMVISDDVDVDWEAQIQSQLDVMADDISANRPVFNIKKIHTDAYVQESSAGGELYPRAKEEMLDRMGIGVLVATYFGHGGEDGLAHERIFLKADGEGLNNICRYNLFVTVTCDYTKFDNPYRQTAGEFMYWNPRGGAVNLITTTREIFMGLGINFNRLLAEYLYDYSLQGDVYVGEALQKTKNDLTDGLRRVVFGVGDPALKLAIPKPGVRLTHVNDVLITDSNVPALEALSRIKLSGEVVDENGIVITNPSGNDLGVLSTVIYDKEQTRETLANDGVTNSLGLIKLNFNTLGEIIFRGQSTVKSDGTFDFEFVVPRDISIPLGQGRVSFYMNKNQELLDYNGYNRTITVGGLNQNAPEDNQGPRIQAFMNDESFVSGGTTGQSPILLLKLEDENGINTASGIGHDITAVLDGDEANPFILNDYYETEPDDFTRGKLSYQFRDLSSGLHTLTIKAWDVYNNSSTTEIQFVVVDENDKLVIDRVLNYPNPFVDYTEFWFTHNSSSDLDVMVQVYTVSGKLIKTIRGTSNADNKGGNSSLSRSLTWNGRDDFGDRIGKGVYVYKLTVKSPATNKTTVKYEKLVIL